MNSAYGPNSDPIAMCTLRLHEIRKLLFYKIEKISFLFFTSIKIFDRKGIDGQVLDAQLKAPIRDLFGDLCTFSMPQCSGKSCSLGKPAVAVLNDGHVLYQASSFYLSLEDNLLRIFGSDRLSGLMQRLGMQEGEAIEHPWVSRAIENAQRKVEGRNFDIRKQLLEYDDVANDQRKVIYQQRNDLLETDDISETINAMRQSVIAEIFRTHVPAESVEEQWDMAGLERALAAGGEVMRAEVMRVAPLIQEGGYIPGCDHGVPPDISWPAFVDYARLLASLGINACAINNVNANPRVLTAAFLPQVVSHAEPVMASPAPY